MTAAQNNAPIGKWNPIWGPEPVWQGPVKQSPKTRYRARQFICPAGCMAEPVAVYGPVDARYHCSICDIEMARVDKVRRAPTPTVVEGQRYGRLVVESVESTRNGRLAHCRCDCGNETRVWTKHLRAGRTHSCGCYRQEYRDRRDHPWYKSYKSDG